MADLTRTNNAWIDATNIGVRISGLQAGEALVAGDAVFIHTDGKLYQSDAADHKDTVTLEAGGTDPVLETSKFDGFVMADYASGEGGVTVYGFGSILTKYSASQTAGSFYWISGTQGSLSDAKIGTNDSAVAKSISTTDILVLR